jgi:TatD DNase family protein
MRKLFDSHSHYFDSKFSEESVGGADALLKELFEDSVEYIVNVGTDLENSKKCVDMAKRYPGMYAAVGIHPGDCRDLSRDEIAAFDAFLKEHSDFKMEKIVAIGEIGFDYYWEPYDKEHQRFFFEEQMKLAEKYGLPVIIHDREAHGDCFDTVLKFNNVKGVFHSYSGSAEMAKELIKRDWYVSFSGVVTFKNANRVREVVASIPLDRILVETDCPYLTPHPYRGKLTHSGLMRYTVDTLAEIFSKDSDEMADILSQNAKKLFKID